MAASDSANELHVNGEITIDDVDLVCNIISRKTGIESIDPEIMLDYINSEKSIYYLNEKMQNVGGSSTMARYAWLDPGVTDKDGDRILISCCNTNHDMFQPQKYKGHVVGSAQALFQLIENYYPKSVDEARVNLSSFSKHLKADIEARRRKDVMKDLREASSAIKAYEEAAEENGFKATDKSVAKNQEQEKEGFEQDFAKRKAGDARRLLMFDPWRTDKGFERYLKIIGNRMQQLDESGNQQYFTLNSSGTVAMVNSGLLDKYGSFMTLLYQKSVDGSFKFYDVLTSKIDATRNGFTKEQADAKLPPVRMYDEVEHFEAKSIDDFDLNYRNLNHVVSERRSRFPESVRGLSDSFLASRMKTAIKTAVSIQQADDGYVRPLYSTNSDGISWACPFRVNAAPSEEPELVLIVHKNGEYYEVKTVLPYDDCMKDKLTATKLYSAAW